MYAGVVGNPCDNFTDDVLNMYLNDDIIGGQIKKLIVSHTIMPFSMSEMEESCHLKIMDSKCQ